MSLTSKILIEAMSDYPSTTPIFGRVEIYENRNTHS